MTETVELRKKPELRIILDADRFEIVDISEPKNSGTFPFQQIKSVELNGQQTNWFISILSWILELFSGNAIVGGNFESQANLKLEMVDRSLKIWLTSVDFEKAKRVAELLNNKKPTHNKTNNPPALQVVPARQVIQAGWRIAADFLN